MSDERQRTFKEDVQFMVSSGCTESTSASSLNNSLELGGRVNTWCAPHSCQTLSTTVLFPLSLDTASHATITNPPIGIGMTNDNLLCQPSHRYLGNLACL